MIEEMLEFLEDDENASYLACDYNNPKQILVQIAAALRAGQEMYDEGREADKRNVYGKPGEFYYPLTPGRKAWDAACGGGE